MKINGFSDRYDCTPIAGDPRLEGPLPFAVPSRSHGTSRRACARARLATDLDGLPDVLPDPAHRGDVTALRLALGSILDIKAHQFVDDDGVPMSFADLARKARDG